MPDHGSACIEPPPDCSRINPSAEGQKALGFMPISCTAVGEVSERRRDAPVKPQKFHIAPQVYARCSDLDMERIAKISQQNTGDVVVDCETGINRHSYTAMLISRSFRVRLKL